MTRLHNVLLTFSGKSLRNKFSPILIRDFKNNWCSKPKEVENGKVKTKCGRGYGMKATTKCNAGFVLRGKNKRVCMENRNWSDKEPVCLAGKLK